MRNVNIFLYSISSIIFFIITINTYQLLTLFSSFSFKCHVLKHSSSFLFVCYRSIRSKLVSILLFIFAFYKTFFLLIVCHLSSWSACVSLFFLSTHSHGVLAMDIYLSFSQFFLLREQKLVILITVLICMLIFGEYGMEVQR